MRRIFNFTIMALAMSLLIISCKKSEKEVEAPLTQLKFTPERTEVEVGKTATVTIVGTWNKTDKVQIANKEIITQQGEVTDNKINLLAKKVGTTKVNVLTADGRNRGNFEVTVTPTSELHFTPKKPEVEIGKATTVTIVGTWNTTDKVQIADKEIVTQQGEVTDNKINLLAKKVGTTKVSVLTADGRNRGSFEITVTPIAELHFTPERPEIEEGKTAEITIVGTWNASDKVKVENTEIVEQQGEVTNNKITLLAKKVGDTKVEIFTANGHKRGSFQVIVTPKLLLSFSPESVSIEEGKTTIVTITGVWNTTDRVQITDGEVAALQGEVTDNKITLLAKKVGATKVEVFTKEGQSRGSFEVTVTPKLLLTFNPVKAVVKKEETTTVTIIGVWNTTDRIQIANNEIVELKGGVTNNKITLLAKKVGNTKVEIFTADNHSRGSFEVSVYTLANTLKLAYKADIPHYKTGITDKEEYKRLIEETLVAYEKLMLELEGLEKYPTDKQYYSKQNDLYLEGIRISREAKQFYKGKKDTANIHELENTYENLHQYGVGYAEVEIMIRIAEQYRKKYPNNTEIEKLIKENFNGGYTSLDGPSLTNYLNNNIVTTFNKIIDIVNSLQ